MTKSKALKKVKEGRFEFIDDIKEGVNYVRYQKRISSSAIQWKQKTITITADKKEAVCTR